MTADPIDIALDYHRAWTSWRFDEAAALLADGLATDVPLNRYAGKDDYVQALTRFGGSARSVELITAVGDSTQAVLIYDMVIDGLGELRVAEHLTVRDGRISAIRHVHDTAVLRKAGFGPEL